VIPAGLARPGRRAHPLATPAAPFPPFPSPAGGNRVTSGRHQMLKVIGGTIGVILIIGLLVVIGLLALIL
jgi:hypothetical protein